MNSRLRAFLVLRGMNPDATDEEAAEYYRSMHEDDQRYALRFRTSGDADTFPWIVETSGEEPEEPAPAGDDRVRAAAGADTLPAAGGEDTIEGAAAPDRVRSTYAEGAQAERVRQQAIRDLAGQDETIPRELVRQAIDDGLSADQAATMFLRGMRANRTPAVGTVAIHSRGHDQDTNVASLEAAMLFRCGLDPVEDHVRFRNGLYEPRRSNNTDDLEQAADRAYSFRDMAYIDIMRECLRLDGVNVGHGQAAVFEATQRLRSFSTTTLDAVFTQHFSAELMQAYRSAEDVTSAFTFAIDVANFQKHEMARTGKMGRLKKHARGGKADHMDYGDIKEEIQIARYSGQFVVDEMDIIDDRFGAIQQQSPVEMGESAAELRPELALAVLMGNPTLLQDSKALFHADHGNLRSSFALNGPNLQTAITDLNTQTYEGRTLNKGGPLVLLTSEAKSFLADQLLNSAETRQPAATTEVGTANPLRNRVRMRVSDGRLDNGIHDPDNGIDYSGAPNDWYLIRTRLRALVIAYLRGRGRAPTIRSRRDLGLGCWGIGWDINHDVGSAANGYIGVFKATG